MARHIAHRLMISLPVLLGVLLIGFLLLQVVPTDPATVSAGPSANRWASTGRSGSSSQNTLDAYCSSTSAVR